METPYRADNLTGMPLEHYMGRLKTADASEISARLGLEWDGRGFTLNVLGEDRHINFPAFDDEGWTDRWRILFGRYLLEGKKASPMHGFLTYPEMPWGETYNEKFRQRCILQCSSFKYHRRNSNNSGLCRDYYDVTAVHKYTRFYPLNLIYL